MNYKSILDQLIPSEGDQTSKNHQKIFLLALSPALLMATLFFGLESLRMIGTAILACLGLKYLLHRFVLKIPAAFRDGPAFITGILLAFTLPAGIPIWLILLDSLLVMGISGLANFKSELKTFNPVLLTWILLRVAFPAQMTIWRTNMTALDAITGATPLSLVKEGLKNGRLISEILSDTKIPGYFDLFWGNMSGAIGEISAIALLIGAIYLLWKQLITWHIPAALLGTFFLLQLIFWLAASGSFLNPIFHLLTGGFLLGAIFLATEPSTSPSSPTGKLLYGAAIGFLTFLLRNFTSLPEGIAIAILVMNGLTPIIRKRFPA